jgi:hypothetical protein
VSFQSGFIKALATGPGMVWFEFKDICEGPRSQNDYIELARLYHTVFISSVPEFTRGNDNAARRFIMLIDIGNGTSGLATAGRPFIPGEFACGEPRSTGYARRANPKADFLGRPVTISSAKSNQSLGRRLGAKQG